MRSMWRFERSVRLPDSTEAVWARMVTPAGINHEMRPWMTMTVPREARGITIDTVELGVRLGRAWLRLFGLLPFDYDLLTIVELEPGHRFREESTMISMRCWVHDRTVEMAPSGEGAVLTDRVEFTPRWWLRCAGPVVRAALEAFFGHRHRRLLVARRTD